MAESNRMVMRLQWRAHKFLWNASGGRLGRKIRGMPVLELVTVGRKSGQERPILIGFVDDEAGPALVATNAGRNIDPAWVQNLRTQPNARARWNGQWHEVTGTELSGEEYDRTWARAVALNPGYTKYSESLSREIPIVRLKPR